MTVKKIDRKADQPEGTRDGRGFEESMKRLEHLVAEMEGGELSLEDMIKRFEEGQELVKFCTGKLNEVEKKIELLVKKGGELTTEPFDEKQDAPEPSDNKVPF